MDERHDERRRPAEAGVLLRLSLVVLGLALAAACGYGGILTDYLIASDTRFKAATSGAGVLVISLSYGISGPTLTVAMLTRTPSPTPDEYHAVP